MRSLLNENQLLIIADENFISTAVHDLRKALQEVFNQDPKVPVILNLEKCLIIDSQGLNLIVGLYKECVRRGLRMQIVGASEANRRLFSIFKLKALFNIEN